MIIPNNDQLQIMKYPTTNDKSPWRDQLNTKLWIFFVNKYLKKKYT